MQVSSVTVLLDSAATHRYSTRSQGRELVRKRSKSSGFTLIELMIVITIIGILASLAVSAYQTYTVRAQVAEGLNMAAGAKVPIVDAYIQEGVAPANRVAAGMSPNPTDTAGDYVSAVTVVDGRIDLTFNGPRVHQAIAGTTLSVTPFQSGTNSSVAWQCGTAPPPPGAALNGGAPHLPPTMEDRYLPSSCRP